MAHEQAAGGGKVDHDADRYASAKRAVGAVLADGEFPEGPVERIELTLLASGEVTWRAWPARAADPVGGYYSKL